MNSSSRAKARAWREWLQRFEKFLSATTSVVISGEVGQSLHSAFAAGWRDSRRYLLREILDGSVALKIDPLTKRRTLLVRRHDGKGSTIVTRDDLDGAATAPIPSAEESRMTADLEVQMTHMVENSAESLLNAREALRRALPGEDACDVCHGAGLERVHGEYNRICNRCKGTGRMRG